MGAVHVDGLDFRCTEVGKGGPLLVLLHGYGGGPLDWHGVIPGIEEKHRLIIPNLKPLFASPKPLPFSKQVEILGQVINQVNRDREEFVLVGASFGATLSWGLRAYFQSLVAGQIMINPMPLSPQEHLKSNQLKILFGMNMVPGALALFLKTPMGQQLVGELAHNFGIELNRGGEKGMHSERKLKLVIKAVQRFAWISQHEDWAYWRDQLRDHLIPLLVITGEKDPLFNEKDFREFQLLCPFSEHISLPSGGHVISRTHGPALAEHISSFVKSLDGGEPLSPESVRRAV